MHYVPFETEKLLADKYRYKPLPPGASDYFRQLYIENLPKGFKLSGDNRPLYTQHGCLVCTGYRRIVVGDYGAFVEFDDKQANLLMFRVQPGQEFRLNDINYSKNVKYNWLTVKDGSDIKIYQQKKTVLYADYIPGMYYISPNECFLSPIRCIENRALDNQIALFSQEFKDNSDLIGSKKNTFDMEL